MRLFGCLRRRVRVNKRVQLKKAPIGDGGMVLIDQQIIDFFGWKVGSFLRLTVDEDGHLSIKKYHQKKGEGC